MTLYTMLSNNIFKGTKQTKSIKQATNFTAFTSQKGSQVFKVFSLKHVHLDRSKEDTNAQVAISLRGEC